MRIGVLGTGNVGRTLGTAFVAAGHEVLLGSRSADNETAAQWAEAQPAEVAGAGTFADAARHGEVLVNATSGAASLDALGTTEAQDRDGKVLVDVANPLDFSTGELRLTVANDDSLAESIQRGFPELRVVKALNTVNASVMVDPRSVPGDHVLPIAGDDEDAKQVTRQLLEGLGWREHQLMDLGGLAGARGMEMYLPLWLRFMQTLGSPNFNIVIERGE